MFPSMIRHMIVPVMVTGSLLFVHPHDAAANAAKPAEPPALEFRYDAATGAYTQRVSKSPVAGGRLRVVYTNERREVLFRYQERLWMRYSFDGWSTCRDLPLAFDRERGVFDGTIDLPPCAGHVSVAFFSTFEGKKSWHTLWDSRYGNNFDIKVIGRRELDEKRRVDLLDAYVAGNPPDPYTTEEL